MNKEMDSLTDEDLMWLLRKDKIDAFEILARRYEKKLLNFLYRFVGNTALAEDLCQQTLLKVYRARKKFKHIGKFSTWMYTIAANLARDYLRKNKKYRFVSFDHPVGENSNILDFYHLPEEPKINHLEQKEMAEVVRIAVESLPTHQKLVILLSHYEMLSYNEIAKVLKCSKGTVKSRIFRAKARLKQLLTSYFLGREVGKKDEVQKSGEDTAGLSR